MRNVRLMPQVATMVGRQSRDSWRSVLCIPLFTRVQQVQRDCVKCEVCTSKVAMTDQEVCVVS